MDPFRSFPSFNSSFTAAAATYLYTSPKQGEVTPFFFSFFFYSCESQKHMPKFMHVVQHLRSLLESSKGRASFRNSTFIVGRWPWTSSVWAK